MCYNKKLIMKRIFYFVAFSVFSLTYGFSQGNLTLEVEVINMKGTPLYDVRVWVEDKTSGEMIIQRTNENGKTTFNIPTGIWSLNLVGLPNYQEFPVYERSHGSGNILITYDLKTIKQEQDFINNRNKIDFTEVDKSGEIVTQPKVGYAVVKIKLQSPSRQPLRKIPVSLVSNKQKKIYKTKSNNVNMALFLVPIDDMYAIDIEDIKNFSFTPNIDREGIITLTLEYEPTNINEFEKDGMIVQDLPDVVEATSSRSHFTLRMKDEFGTPFENENVFLHEIHGSKIYVAQTDENGKAEFLLPTGIKYMIHFEYEKDVDVLNLTTVHGRNTTTLELVYRPDPRLQYPEEFIPKPEELFLEEFESYIDKQLPDPGEELVGIYLKWGNEEVNANTKEAILEVDIAVTQKRMDKDKAPPVNLAFVIDKSGSMAGYDRIESLQESMTRFVNELRPTDNVSLITFNTLPFLEIPMQNVGDGTRIKQIINEVEAGGGTNIYNGMVMGYEKLLEVYDAEKKNHLLLLTDGFGETEPKIVIEKSREYNARGIGISAVGVGEYYNAALLKLLTESEGLMQHAGKSEDIYEVFKEQLLCVVYPLGLDARLEISFNANIELTNMFGLSSPDWQANSAIFDLGDIFSGMNSVSLAEFTLNMPDEEIEKEPVTVALTYYDLSQENMVTLREEAYLDWNPVSGKLELIKDSYQKKLYAIAILNQSIKVMVDAFAERDITKAIQTYERASAQILDLFPDAKEEDLKNLINQMGMYAEAVHNYQKNLNK